MCTQFFLKYILDWTLWNCHVHRSPMVDNPLFLIVRPVPRNRVTGSQGMFRLRRWWKHFVCFWWRFALPAVNESSIRSTFSPILGIIQAILIVQSCFTNEKMNDIILRKVEAFTGFQESKELIFLLTFVFFLAENRCTSYWRILRVNIRYLEELWVWLHPFLSVPGLREPRWRETFCLISSLVIWERIKHRFFQEKRTAGSSGGQQHTLHTIKQRPWVNTLFLSW